MDQVQTYPSDELHRKVWLSLHRDFSREVGAGLFLKHKEALVKGSIQEYRQCTVNESYQCDPMFHKMVRQLRDYHKRYVFADDESCKTISRRTTERFIALQERLASQPARQHQTTYLVVQRARLIVKRILGDYDKEEHMMLCKFGTRASVGCTASEAYLDSKLLKTSLTGSPGHLSWFKSQYLPTDALLSEVLNRSRKFREGQTFEECDSLSLVEVPKSYKINRGISPDTVIGGLYSAGLGRVVQKRLLDNGIDITKQESRHRELARICSKTRRLATGDLSDASSTWCSDTIRMLVPYAWYRHFNLGRIRSITVKGRRLAYQSFMAMGIGFTFPLQTLLYYALLVAIAECCKWNSSSISVYGDDLIYPSEMHPYVVSVFTDLRFKMNLEKTFVTMPFRESCGGDYYRGMDVRPYSPEGTSAELSRLQYLSLLHQVYNGLRERWSERRIAITLRFLRLEILRVSPSICYVPADMPEYSGIRVTRPPLVWYEPHSINLEVEPTPAQLKAGATYIQGYAYRYLQMRAPKRFVFSEATYYWDKLRTSVTQTAAPLPYSSATETFYLVRVKEPRGVVKGKKKFEWVWRAAVTRKLAPMRLSYEIGTTSQWTEVCEIA